MIGISIAAEDPRETPATLAHAIGDETERVRRPEGSSPTLCRPSRSAL